MLLLILPPAHLSNLQISLLSHHTLHQSPQGHVTFHMYTDFSLSICRNVHMYDALCGPLCCHKVFVFIYQYDTGKLAMKIKRSDLICS